MVKIININTGKVRTLKKPKPRDCGVCGIKVYERDESTIFGNINDLPIAFCQMCVGGIVKILVDKQNGER